MRDNIDCLRNVSHLTAGGRHVPVCQAAISGQRCTSSVCAGYSLLLSGLVCLGTNTVGFLVAMVTKTHKITDLIVRSQTLPLLCTTAT